MELYKYAKGDLMAGRKIVYLHGFASSGRTGTAASLRLLLPGAEVLSPDIPVDPEEAMPFLKDYLRNVNPDLVIGTSMGGMYAEQMEGWPRICVNPALHLADTILKNNGLGMKTFHNPREDGQTEFMVTKSLLEKYRSVSEGRLKAADPGNVWGLFGKNDTMVDCYAEFSSRYPRSIRFEGAHQLNDSAIVHSLMPVIRRVETALVRKKRPVAAVGMETLRTLKGLPAEGCQRAVSAMDDRYDVYFISRTCHDTPSLFAEDCEWLDSAFGVLAFDRVVSCPDRSLLMADYLVFAPCRECPDSPESFVGTALEYGKEPFRDWKALGDYFSMLGGQ